jgi:hypothetical protein
VTPKRIVPCSTSTSCQSDGISGSYRICPNFKCNYTYRERALASLSTPKLCAVRCEPLILLNRHFSDSDGGADGTVGKLSVTRVRPCQKVQISQRLFWFWVQCRAHLHVHRDERRTAASGQVVNSNDATIVILIRLSPTVEPGTFQIPNGHCEGPTEFFDQPFSTSRKQNLLEIPSIGNVEHRD